MGAKVRQTINNQGIEFYSGFRDGNRNAKNEKQFTMEFPKSGKKTGNEIRLHYNKNRNFR